MRLFTGYLKKNLVWLFLNMVGIVLLCSAMILHKIRMEDVAYFLLLWIFIAAIVICVNYIKYRNHHRKMLEDHGRICISMEEFQEPQDQIEADYQNLIQEIQEQRSREQNRIQKRQTDWMEYYTMWIHQIKTPIAAMNLLLDEAENGNTQELKEELFQIQEYANMALQYLRLDSESTDYVFRTCSLDEIIREAVRKYAGMFIRKKISLNYDTIGLDLVTDEKWLEFVIEQMLSNGLKYTQKGSISVYLESQNPYILVIEDTGIGIRPEDLPRIWEKGYTGYNGHNDKCSTGIGLYLCKKVMDKLNNKIWIESEVGKGTKVKIGFEEGVCKIHE